MSLSLDLTVLHLMRLQISSCSHGLNDVFGNIGPLVPGQQYLIAISSYGDTGGNFDFNVKFDIGPANDDKCADLTAFDLGLGGTLLINLIFVPVVIIPFQIVHQINQKTLFGTSLQ